MYKHICAVVGLYGKKKKNFLLSLQTECPPLSLAIKRITQTECQRYFVKRISKIDKWQPYKTKEAIRV